MNSKGNLIMEQSATNKILCPWCGGEMKRWVEYEIPKPLYYTAKYICGECEATSPQQVHTDRERAKELAKEAALKRFKPLQKPMTLEEAVEGVEPVWLEGKDDEIQICSLVYSKFSPCGDSKIYAYLIGDEIPGLWLESYYNKVWRCWATKPTEEERQAAEWITN